MVEILECGHQQVDVAGRDTEAVADLFFGEYAVIDVHPVAQAPVFFEVVEETAKFAHFQQDWAEHVAHGD